MKIDLKNGKFLTKLNKLTAKPDDQNKQTNTDFTMK